MIEAWHLGQSGLDYGYHQLKPMFQQIVIPLLSLPSDVHCGDIDGDGTPEILVVSDAPKKNLPKGQVVDIYAWNGTEFSHQNQVSFSNRALIWDIDNGWWGIDASGLINVLSGEGIVKSHTWLSTLGPTTPIAADIASDLNGDGLAEVIWPEQGQWRVFSVDGHDWGSVASPVSGRLQHTESRGGLKHRVTHESASMQVVDVDGQGTKDIVLISRNEAVVTLTQQQGLGASHRVTLPIDVDPSSDFSKPGGKELSNVWFRDINGDGQMDMAWQYWVTKDSWFGATAELGMSIGDGRRFGQKHSAQTEQAIVDVRWADWDSSGVSDLLLLGVDLGMGTLARALLSKSVSLNLFVQPITQNGFEDARIIWTFTAPIDGSEDIDYDVGFDWTGDDLPDMLLLQSGLLELYANQGKTISETQSAQIEVNKAQKLKVFNTEQGHFALTWGKKSKQLQLTWLGQRPF